MNIPKALWPGFLPGLVVSLEGLQMPQGSAGDLGMLALSSVCGFCDLFYCREKAKTRELFCHNTN